MDIVWSRMSSASGYRDGVYGVCFAEGNVYAVGFDELHGYGKKRYRIESYSVRDGVPLAKWADDKSYTIASLTSCVSARGHIYAFGASERFWSILEFDKDLNLVKRVDIDKPYLVPFSAVALDRYIYVVGTTLTSEGSTAMYVARVVIDTLSMDKSFSTDREGRGAGAYAVAYNKIANRVVVGGFDRSEGAMNWLLTFLTRDLELIKIVRPDVKGSITGLAVNPEGSIYAVSRDVVAKFGREGELIISTTSVPGVKVYSSQDPSTPISVNAVVIADNDAYVLSSDRLSIVDSTRLSRGPQILTTFIGSMDSDNDKVYVALTQVVTKDDWNWAVQALRPRGRRLRIFGR
ncbi:MAG: hypothetical protein QW775_00850 [Ignisphaera sp.]|uniref:WD40 repeat domain-containing protein n=1 Tax=Ignisphaera aggregans TaxID=334771 RepID=A0A7C4NM67_9CREN